MDLFCRYINKNRSLHFASLRSAPVGMTGLSLQGGGAGMVKVAAPLGERSRSFGGLWRFGRPAGIAALIAILCFLSLYPMLMLLYGSLHSTPPGIPGTFNLDGYLSIPPAANLVV